MQQNLVLCRPFLQPKKSYIEHFKILPFFLPFPWMSGPILKMKMSLACAKMLILSPGTHTAMQSSQSTHAEGLNPYSALWSTINNCYLYPDLPPSPLQITIEPEKTEV